MLREEQKQQILYPLSSSKSSLWRVSGSISEKIIDWQQTKVINWLWKMVKERQKTANTVPTVFEQKFGFESFGLHFWENNWLTSNNNDQIDLKRCWVRNKNSKYCAHYLWAKVRFLGVKEPFVHITVEGIYKKTLKKSHKSLPFTIKTSLGQKQTLLIL